MDSMNYEVLCDLSARLGHEMKLKDEQNQAMLVPYPQNIFLKCARIHRNFCLQRQRTFKIPFKIQTSGDVLIGLFSSQNHGNGMQHSMGLWQVFLPSFPPPVPSPLPSPPLPQTQESLLRRLSIYLWNTSAETNVYNFRLKKQNVSLMLIKNIAITGFFLIHG